tara:strand:- start:164 stop:340 length:177 start_codon:yes stop_codon:yes gene_type:complete
MDITSAKYIADTVTSENASIEIVVNGDKIWVPLAPGNRHYDEIQRQVAAGTLTIQDAD